MGAQVGADKFAADTMGYNALHHASMMGLTMMVHYLVSHGFDVEAGDAQGHTALHWAAYRGHHETATYLVGTLSECDREMGEGEGVRGCGRVRGLIAHKAVWCATPIT